MFYSLVAMFMETSSKKKTHTIVSILVCRWTLHTSVAPLDAIIYRRDRNKSGGGTRLLHAPPTAHMIYSIASFAVAVDTLGGYN